MQTQALLAKLVSINSVFPSDHPDPDRPGEREIAEFIEALLKDLGFAVQRQHIGPHRFNVLAEKGQGEGALLLYGHMDTVPSAKGWGDTDPWMPRVEGDRLYGLGASDMKAGLCIILQAVQDFTPEGYKLKLAFFADEENISEGAYRLIQSPWVEDVVAALVPESSTSKSQHLGPPMPTLGRRGRIDLDVQVRGRAAHAAHQELGVSALLRGAIVALALERLPLAEHPQLGQSSVTIRRFVSEAGGLSIPELAELRLDRHLVPPETPESARREVEDLIEKLYQEGALERDPAMPITVSVPERRTPYLMPYVTPVNQPFVRLIADIVREQFGHVEYNYGPSVADENYFGAELGLPVVVLGPAGDNIHAPHEWVSLSSVEELIAIYKKILENFSKEAYEGNLPQLR